MGILWPRSNISIFNSGGTRAAGAKIYFFDSGTTTPRVAYSDAALTTPRTNPVICDGYGRAPSIFLAFGDYRERVQTSGGVTIWDTDNIPNAAPFTASQAVDPTTLLQTGQTVFEFIDGTRSGFVRANGRTIGSAASVANERANADAAALYTYLYNAIVDAACPVSGGRGANAASDFAANKTLTLPDLRGAAPIGLDTMGNSAASRFDASVPFSVGSATAAGSTAGQNHHTLTSAQLASHTHAITSVTVSAGSAHSHGLGSLATVSNGSHSHTITISEGSGHQHGMNGPVSTNGTASVYVAGSGASGGTGIWGGGDGANRATALNTTGITASSDSQGAHTHTFSGALANESAHTHTLGGSPDATGGGAAHNNLGRSVLGTWYIKL